MAVFDDRFRSVANYCSTNGFPAGFPTFRDQVGATPVMYEVVVMTQGASGQDVAASALGNPAAARDRLIAACDFATHHGKGHGFPNFHQAGTGSNIVYGTMLLDVVAVQPRAVRVDEIFGTPLNPTTRPLEDWFKACADWASRNGLPAAMPTGEANGVINGHPAMNVVVFNPGYTQVKSLSQQELQPPPVQVTVGSGW